MTRYRIKDLPILENLTGRTIYYGALTPWWSDIIPPYLTPNDLPCDPLGGVLMMTPEGKAKDFIAQAQLNPQHYGIHGIDAFRAAYHGVIEVFKLGDKSGHTIYGKDRWIPTAFKDWDGYNKVLSIKKNKAGEFSL